MKRTLLLGLIFISLSAFAQKRTYVGLGAGVNNISGMTGLNFETPIDSNFSVKIGAGYGWGVKTGVSAKYYRSYPTSLGLGVGFSYASGMTMKNVKVEQKDKTKIESDIKWKPAQMIDLTICKSWGERLRFNLEFGYSIKVSGGEYEIVRAEAKNVSDTYDKATKLMSPGGLILAVGLSYGF